MNKHVDFTSVPFACGRDNKEYPPNTTVITCALATKYNPWLLQ